MDPLQSIAARGMSLGRSSSIDRSLNMPALGADSTASAPKVGFVDAIGGALDKVNQLQESSANLSKEFQMENPDVGLEETMIAMQKASLGFQAAVQVRNKVVQAYNDIMNMSV
jgi:flagellar hook-basal body complex protein FliE